MTSRRQLLAGLATATTAPLAGCSPCGETWYADQLAFDLDRIERADSGWDLAVTATASFHFPKREDGGFGPFDVALYGADTSLLDYETVDGLRWSDVPEIERTETDCGDHGSTSVTRSFTVDERPHYVGPRFVEGHEASSLDPNSSSGFNGLDALRYAPAGDSTTATNGTTTTDGTTATTDEGTPATTGGRTNATATNGTAGTDGTTATADEETTATTGEGTTATGTAERPTGTATGDGAVTPADYETVAIEALPWPEPDNQAVTETDRLTNVRFRTSPACTSRGGAEADTGFFVGDLVVEWARPIPNGSCARPFLESLSSADRRLTVRVGLHEPSHVRCRDCEYIRYRLVVDAREGAEPVFDEVEFLHVSEGGEVEERIVEQVKG